MSGLTRSVAALLLLTCSGCLSVQRLPGADGGAAPELDGALARVYLIRESAFGGGAVAWFVCDSGHPVGDIGNGDYFCFTREAGEMSIWVHRNLGITFHDVEVEPGDNYFMMRTRNRETHVETLGPVAGRKAVGDHDPADGAH